MITFKGLMYNATTQQYIDSTPQIYSFAWYSANDFTVYDQGQALTNVPKIDFQLDSPSTNVGWVIERCAKQYYNSFQAWPELRLCTSDSTSNNVLIWRHSAPTNLTLIANGKTIVWRHCFQWSDTIDTTITGRPFNYVGSYLFTSVDTKDALDNTAIVWTGSCCGDLTDPNAWYTTVSYVDINIQVDNPQFIVVKDQQLGTYYTNSTCVYTYDGIAIGAIVNVGYSSGSTRCGPCFIIPVLANNTPIPPFNITATAIRVGTQVYNFDLNTSPQTYEYQGQKYLGVYSIDAAKQYDEFTPTGLTVPYITATNYGIWSSYTLGLILQQIQPQSTYTQKELYIYLSQRISPVIPDTNVDPDNIPPTTEPITPIVPDDPDPYTDPETPGKEPSTTGGGQTDPPQTPTDVTPPAQPPSHAINSHFLTIYIPTLAQLNSLAQYLWSPSWSVDAFKKIFANPIDCILGLMVFPALTYPTGTQNLMVGNLDTEISMNYTTNQFVDLNCGTFTLEEFYGSYLDYSPYTKVQIYLPYIGMRTLSPDDIMGKPIHLLYRIDLLSSACVAFLEVDGTTLYTFSGSCGTSIPVSGSDWSNMLNGILGVGGSAVAVAATGGASAIPIAAGLSSASSLAVASIKPEIQRSGAVMSSAGLMGIQIPYLIVTRPRQSVAENQNSFTGYPANITMNLSACTGFTKVEEVHLDGIPATQEEIREIERLLKEGVYI